MLFERHNFALQQVGQYMATIVLCISSLAIFYFAATGLPTDRHCVSRSFSWSPASAAIEYHWENFENVDFFTVSPYFGLEQTEAIERAWGQLLPEHPIAIPKSRLLDLNQQVSLDDDTWAHDTSHPESILAIPEVFVQLHCLDIVRRFSYQLQDDDDSVSSSPLNSTVTSWKKVNECLERLRRAVMCWGDTGVIMHYFDTAGEPSARNRLLDDLSSYHKCRDFEKIKLWMSENRVESTRMDSLWAENNEENKK